MRRSFVVASLTLFLSAIFAGCVSEDPANPDQALDAGTMLPPGYVPPEGVLSEDIYDILPDVTAYVDAFDGILLHTRIHLPDGEGPWPTILQLSPYHLHSPDISATGYTTPDEGGTLVERYVPKGYAVVIADVRGTGNSEGCLEMMGTKERQDAHDLVEWIAQQSWSDGKVGMQGVSYVGTTPHEALVMAPEHLVTVVTIAGVTNQWRNTFMNGVPYAHRHYPITYNLWGAQPATDVENGPAWAEKTATGGCGQEEAIAAMSPGTYEKGLYDAYWDDRNQTRFVEQANQGNASILYSQGFVDRAVNPSEAIGWFNELTIPKKGLFHQAGHRYAPRADYFDMELAWFDHWLKGMDTGIMDTPTVEVQLNDGRIRTGENWPPVGHAFELLRFHLTTDALVPDAPAEGSESYLADPEMGRADVLGATRSSEGRLLYVSEPFVNETILSGPARMHLVGSSEATNTYWLFDIYDRAPDGTNVWLAEGWMNAHLHEAWDRSTPLVPGEKTTFEFRFEPREYVLSEGHRLVLELDGREPNVLPFDQPRHTNTIHYGASGTYLELPVLVDPELWAEPEATKEE